MTLLQNFYSVAEFVESQRPRQSRIEAHLRPPCTQICGLRPGTLWTKPQLIPRSIRECNFNSLELGIDFAFIGSVWRRLGSAGAEGLRGNEA
jgi:hypothetical protein